MLQVGISSAGLYLPFWLCYKPPPCDRRRRISSAGTLCLKCRHHDVPCQSFCQIIATYQVAFLPIIAISTTPPGGNAMKILLVLSLTLVLSRAIFRGIRARSYQGQNDVFPAQVSSLQTDPPISGNVSLHQMWYLRGLVWREDWKRWVPDITSCKNESYWEQRGYRWDNRLRRWSKA